MKASERMIFKDIESILIDGYARINTGGRYGDPDRLIFNYDEPEWIIAVDGEGREIARYNLRCVAEIRWAK